MDKLSESKVSNFDPIRNLAINLTGDVKGYGIVDLNSDKENYLSGNSKTLTINTSGGGETPSPSSINGYYVGDSCFHDFGGKGGMIIYHFWTNMYVGRFLYSMKIDGATVLEDEVGISNASNMAGFYSMAFYLSGSHGTKVISVTTTEDEVSHQSFTILGD